MHLVFSRIHLRAVRVRAGYSRPRLAWETSLAASTIKSYEQGYSNPSVAALGRLAGALGCGVNEFYSAASDVA
jgi:transcriptional regulator with XRE-family HTH domain